MRLIDADEVTKRVIENSTDEDRLKLVLSIADCPTVEAQKVKHGIKNIVRIDNLMYDGCEPHWKCKRCGMCVPFHCWNREQFAMMECKKGREMRND